MSRRLLLCVALLALTLGSVPSSRAAPAPPSPAARYKGTYFLFVQNFQTFFVYGGVFTIAANGAVVGKIITGNSTVGNTSLGNNTLYPISGNIVNLNGSSQGRFAVDLVHGANITTITVGATSVGQLVGRQETPTALYPLTGSMYNSFYSQAGTYRGITNDGRVIVFTVGLQRRISGSFEQTPGDFVALFGGGNIAGLNGRSYLSMTFFNATYTRTTNPITASGTWREGGNKVTGTFTVTRMAP